MRKYTIIGIIVLMSISLLGVVGLQLYWINNAIKVKQELFEKNVHEALAKVVEKLETREAISVVTGQMAALQDSAALDSSEGIDSPSFSISKMQITIDRKGQKPKTAPVPVTPIVNTKTSKAETLTATKTAEQAKGFKPARIDNGQQKHILLWTDSLTLRPDLKALHYNRPTFIKVDSVSGTRVFRSYASGPADTATFRRMVKGQPYRTEKITNAAGSPLRLEHKFFKIPADSLRHVAFKLDSLKPTDISSINIKNDSVYIYRKDEVKPYLVYKAAKYDSNTIFRTHSDRQTQETNPVKIRGKAKLTHTTPVKVTPAELKQDASQKIEVKKDKLNDVVQKMMVEYVAKDIPLRERLNVNNLQALLSDELRDKGIDMDYGYHVVSGKDTVALKYAGDATTASDDTRYFATFLFPNDIVEKPDYLAVYFKDTQSYGMRSLAGMMSLSGLFTLIIIATFAATIHIIYKQKRLSEMKNDFINNMTHEFKTPIATISLATDSIFNPKVYENPDKIRYYTNIIKDENKRMNAQVENVLQIALLEKNDFKLNMQPVDVHTLILKAIESIKLQIEQRMGQINIRLEALEHELMSDETHLFNVICNLLDNANKYSPSTPEIELTTQNVAGGLLIAVDDKGMGMNKDTQLRVFEKFYRVPTGNLHNVKGFGLGLSYVKAIVQAHNGNIKLWSEPGKGSRFEIFLPFRN